MTAVRATVSENDETEALDLVYAWLGGDRAARTLLTRPEYDALTANIAQALADRSCGDQYAAAPAAGSAPAADGVDPAEIARQRALGWPDMHPEDYCHRCGRPNPTWFADAAEWQTATGSTGDGGGILCPSCFCALWEQVTGRTAIIWRLSIDPRSRDAAPADPAAGEAKLRDEVTREIAAWMAAPHEPEQWQIDNADDLAANLLTGPLAALVAERDQAQATAGTAVSGEAAHCSTCICGRRAPVQGEYRGSDRRDARPSGTVSWEEHLEAYVAYAARFGRSQSPERMAERQGFGYWEMTDLLGHEPTTWSVR